MAGINPNLGNLKLTNLQLNPTAKVDTKAPEQEVGDAKPAAVWNNSTSKNKVNQWKDGDVVVKTGFLGIRTYYRVSIDKDGVQSIEQIKRRDLEESDFENNRGNYNKGHYIDRSY